ncbi:hypothetical protein [Pasteurella canis]|uniref:hypothetical protein n=1 Tax=Pasteurella canis TaxID=753 RepID=UPI001E2DCF25|nr:hypothetical protein [Pasteurella canis]UEC23925.1 hypothetical protein K7G93_000693 [Pasteurella canis]UEC23934.1 hypothetical protein K7G93_000703 [Pasteurella canis]UEC23943.1 hypothetical protein K7G93_000713 [Pasteurella canis]UEC23952.1 hypothetical protein K7G93_000723 [Pasteurella canis]
MRLCCRSGLFKLILILPLLFISTFSHSRELWSSVGYWYFRKNLNNDDAISKTDCDLSKFAGSKKTDGDKNAPRVDIRIKVDSSGVVTDYGDGEGGSFSGDGWFRYAEKIEFSSRLSSSQNSVAREAFKTALKNNNCQIADSLLDALTNPNLREDGMLSIDGDGYKCAITNSGLSDCLVEGAAETCDENGENCHISIGNEKRMGLDELAKTKEKEKQNGSDNSGSNGSSNQNNGHGGNSGADGTGSGNASGNNSSGGKSDGKNQGSKGDKDGQNGSGSGVGSGEGDKKGDGKDEGKLPELEEFDIKKSLEELKSKLSDMVGGQCSVSGNCQPITFSLFNATHTIDIHCKLFSENGDGIKSGFTFLWTTIGILIILSA